MKNLILLITLTISALSVNAQLPGCATSVNTFPYFEGFETNGNLGNWNNAAGDNFNWTQDNSGTPSAGTGPTTGSSASTYYMFIETTGGAPGNEAWFESFCFDFTALSSPEISFDYHMYGTIIMGTLELLVSTNGTTWTSLWTLSGNQGNAWNTASVSLSAYAGQTVEFRFRGVRGTSFTGDAAIDNINIIDQVAMAYTSSTVTQGNTATVVNCASNVEIIGIEVVTSGVLTPVDITQLRLRTNGSTSPAITSNVSNIDIYYTGTSSTFATTTFFGNAAPLLAGNNIFVNGTQTLSSGTNYFWVVYDMAVGANIGDLLDARCTRIIVDGANQTPTTINPAGTRTIVACTPSPGSVSSDLTLWFKSDASVYSDAGATAVTNGGTIQQWNEQSGNASVANVNQITGADQPTYDDDPFNYNPAILFDNAGDFLASGDVPFSSFTDGSKISMYGVMKGLGGGAQFTWDDVGVGAKIVLGTGASFFDRNGGNNASTGFGSTNTEQHLVSTVIGGNAMNAYIEGDLKNTSTIVNLNGTKVSPVTFGKLFEHGFPSSVLFGEVAIYDASHSATDKNRIESYFAVKYGITLDNSAGGIAGDYSASFSTQVWDADVNATYHNNVIGLARDDSQFLLQKQSHTIDDTTRIYLNTLQTTNVANTGSFSSDVSYIMMGDNQGEISATTASSAEIPGTCGLHSRLEREWKVTRTSDGTLFKFDVKLNPNAGPSTVNSWDLGLLIDDDGDFSNGGTSCYYAGDGSGIFISYVNPVITISNISSTMIPNNSTRYMTIGSFNSVTPLPVELLSFEANCDDNNVELNWTTASEINNDYFTIERSSDAVNFEPIGTVNGNGNSNSLQKYTWTDDSPINETTYYRLKQTDFNGAVEYHRVKSVTCEQLNDISIYPNPFTNGFTVQLSENTIYPTTVEVIDYLGRTVHSQVIESATTEITLDEKIATGTYFVKVFNETTQVIERLVKMK